MPGEETIRFSGMTGQSLFYLDSDEIRHNILAISEDEGIREAAYALETACKAKANCATPPPRAARTAGWPPRPITSRAPCKSCSPPRRWTSTRNSSIVVSFLPSMKRNTKPARFNPSNASRLRPNVLCSTHKPTHYDDCIKTRSDCFAHCEVYNPYATQLTFPNHKTRMRRDHLKYLNLISTIALLHQHQRTDS